MYYPNRTVHQSAQPIPFSLYHNNAIFFNPKQPQICIFILPISTFYHILSIRFLDIKPDLLRHRVFANDAGGQDFFE